MDEYDFILSLNQSYNSQVDTYLGQGLVHGLCTRGARFHVPWPDLQQHDEDDIGEEVLRWWESDKGRGRSEGVQRDGGGDAATHGGVQQVRLLAIPSVVRFSELGEEAQEYS